MIAKFDFGVGLVLGCSPENREIQSGDRSPSYDTNTALLIGYEVERATNEGKAV